MKTIKKDKPIIEIIEAVYKSSRQSKLIMSKVKAKSGEELTALENYLNVPLESCILFTVIITENLKARKVDIEVINDHFGFEGLQVLKYVPFIEKLADKRYIKFEELERNDITHRGHEIRPFVFKAITENTTIKDDTLPVITNDSDFISYVSDLYNEYQYDNMEKLELVKLCANDCREINIVQFLKSHNVPSIEIVLLAFCINNRVQNEFVTNMSTVLEFISSSTQEKCHYQKKVLNNELAIQKLGFVAINKGNFQSYEVLLTPQLEALVDESIKCLFLKKNSNDNYKTPSSIVKVPLYFNKSIGNKINELYSILDHGNFKEIQSRMEQNNIKSGFTILFHGESGTGKTETVYQIARETGRDLLQVDVSTLKSCWFGESQKNIRTLFNNFKSTTKDAVIKPILFFNEVDALFSKRVDIGSTVDQTSNAIQNIILEEMEDFNGIMIASTNLTDNLDSAFERRFLYKLRFEKPDNEAQAMIWKSKFEGLSDDECSYLSGRYDFTGAGIENISRKVLVNHILRGSLVTLECVEKIIVQEEWIFSNRGRIGFKI